jgi:EAL domain-containing protein (putative c-di-GMP-specific phosphodiesterase class I)
MAGFSILVVDEDVDIVEYYISMLQSVGLSDINTAYEGALGVELAVNLKPDVIIIDMNLPVLDGVEVIYHLAEVGFEGSVILTGDTDVSIMNAAREVAEASQIAVLGVLRKPFRFNQLFALLDRRRPGERRRAFVSGCAVTKEEIVRGLVGNAEAVVLHYQPKVNVKTGKAEGVEALARWRHPEKGLLAPAQFIDGVARAGLMPLMTNAVIRKSLAQLSAWNKAGFSLNMSINVTIDDLAQTALVEDLVRHAGANHVDPARITLEVLETQVMRDIKAPLGQLARLRLKGFGIAIDDFGVGSSTMAQLKQVPCTELKIDRMFIQSNKDDEDILTILEFCVNLGKSLGLKLVAEGVETAEEMSVINYMGCDEYQGFYFSKPLPPEDVIRFFARPSAVVHKLAAL